MIAGASVRDLYYRIVMYGHAHSPRFGCGRAIPDSHAPERNMIDANHPFPRRGFLGRVALLATPFMVGRASVVGGQAPVRAAAGTQHLDWLDRLTGTHKTVFDVETHRSGNALAQADSFLNAWREAGVPDGDVTLVMGVRGSGLPLVLGDAVWAKYRLGTQYALPDPRTREPADRNLFVNANVQTGGPVTARQTIEALQQRGVVMLACMNTIKGASRKLAAAGLGTPDTILADLRDSVLPGVTVVPAMIVAFTLMHERGVAYVYTG